MNVAGIVRIISAYLYILTGIVAVGLTVSLYYQQDVAAFVLTNILVLASALILDFSTRGSKVTLLSKESILAVCLIWLISIAFCSIPFVKSRTLEHKADALFETVSALTSTGATVLHAKQYDKNGQELPITVTREDVTYRFFGTVAPKGHLVGIEAVSPPILFWRSWLEWVGGAGMILLFVALLPALGEEAKKLFRFEATGPNFTPLFPQARQTALTLLGVYSLLTVACVVLLMYTNQLLPLFDAVNIAFATISTGGFSVKNMSIAAYNSTSTEFVVCLFMILGAINFACYYNLIKGRLSRLKDPELIMFGCILLAGCLLVSWNLLEIYSLPTALRQGFFQLISTMTTTGFFTANYDEWPKLSQALMLVSMFVGGMSGSTAAGLKIIRVLILWQCLKFDTSSILSRSEVRVVRLWGKEIDADTCFRVLAFFLTLIVSTLVGLLFIIADGVDLETSLGLAASMINNAGLAFRMAGPLESCAFLSLFSKVICMIWMLLGRLEFYCWFALLLPKFWKSY